MLKSEIFQIHRREANDRYIHAAAFVAHQFFRSQDNLVDIWLSVMASFQTATSREHKEKLLEDRKDHHQRLKTAVHDLDKEVSGLIEEIRRFACADDLSDTQKVAAIRGALKGERTEALDRLKVELDEAESDRSWHDVLEAHSLRLQNRLNPILRVLTFEPNERSARLIAAIDHFKAHDGAITSRAPMGFLSADDCAALIRGDPLGDLFPQRHDVPLAQVLETINRHCGMLAAFEHWQQIHIRQAASRPALLAGIMELGCAIGVRKMARIHTNAANGESYISRSTKKHWKSGLSRSRAQVLATPPCFQNCCRKFRPARTSPP